MNEQPASKKTAIKPYPRRCAECGEAAVAPTTIAYDAQVKHDGRLHTFRIASLGIDKCQSCGEEYFTNSTDEQISAGLRESIGLLHPKDIRCRLDEFQISQRVFAEHLRVAPETVSRWMTGLAIQTRALDTLMRVYFAFPSVRKALARGGPLSDLGLKDAKSAGSDCEVVARPLPISSSVFATRRTAFSMKPRFDRLFGPDVLARREAFAIVMTN
jgi:DNA-binding transcriptional regulator YiaG